MRASLHAALLGMYLWLLLVAASAASQDPASMSEKAFRPPSDRNFFFELKRWIIQAARATLELLKTVVDCFKTIGSSLQQAHAHVAQWIARLGQQFSQWYQHSILSWATPIAHKLAAIFWRIANTAKYTAVRFLVDPCCGALHWVRSVLGVINPGRRCVYLFNAFTQWAAELAHTYATHAKTNVASLVAAVNSGCRWVGSLLCRPLAAFGKAVSAVGRWLGELLEKGWACAAHVGHRIASALLWPVRYAGHIVYNVVVRVGGAVEALVGWAVNMATACKDHLYPLWDTAIVRPWRWVLDMLGTAWTWVLDMLGTAWTWVLDMLGTPWTQVKDFLVVRVWQPLWGALLSAMSSTVLSDGVAVVVRVMLLPLEALGLVLDNIFLSSRLSAQVNVHSFGMTVSPVACAHPPKLEHRIHRSTQHVHLHDNTTYVLGLWNGHSHATDCVVSVDGVEIGRYRVDAHTSVTIERPVYTPKKLMFTVPRSAKGGASSSQELGIIEAQCMSKRSQRRLQVKDPLFVRDPTDKAARPVASEIDLGFNSGSSGHMSGGSFGSSGYSSGRKRGHRRVSSMTPGVTEYVHPSDQDLEELPPLTGLTGWVSMRFKLFPPHEKYIRERPEATRFAVFYVLPTFCGLALLLMFCCCPCWTACCVFVRNGKLRPGARFLLLLLSAAYALTYCANRCPQTFSDLLD